MRVAFDCCPIQCWHASLVDEVESDIRSRDEKTQEGNVASNRGMHQRRDALDISTIERCRGDGAEEYHPTCCVAYFTSSVQGCSAMCCDLVHKRRHLLHEKPRERFMPATNRNVQQRVAEWPTILCSEPEVASRLKQPLHFVVAAAGAKGPERATRHVSATLSFSGAVSRM